MIHYHLYHAAWTAAFAWTAWQWGWMPVLTAYLVIGTICFWRA
jgi:hypothetical protein